MTIKNWSVCDEADDGKHVARPAAVNDEGGERRGEYILTVECANCYQTTGVPMPPETEIDWG